jgi:hypothetical protein
METETLNQMLARHQRELEALRMELRTAGLARDKARREQEAADEARRNQQIAEERIDAEARALHPSQMLNELRAKGATVEADDTGVITVSPPGLLSPVHRAVIASRRAEVISLIRASQQIETL